MPSTPVVKLVPSGERIAVALGTSLKDVLFAQGFEFPCAGQEECGRCRIRLTDGAPRPTTADLRVLSGGELRRGWRLACHIEIRESLTVELPACDVPILADETRIDLPRRPGKGLAIDLGTTSLVAQLVDLSSAQVLGTRSALNPQARFSGELIGRIHYATASKGGREELTHILRERVAELVSELLAGDAAEGADVCEVALVGNTVMHHLFAGLGVEGLASSPFEATSTEAQHVPVSKLGWSLPRGLQATVLPCVDGFVGSDLLAGLLATRIAERDTLSALVDLGTNGEVAIGARGRVFCASTAAGPAFEGGGISCGMRAASGAIDSVEHEEGALRCHVIGAAPPRGVCGSGLLDAIAEGLRRGELDRTGRLLDPQRGLELLPPVRLSQQDVRQLQLAKGAVAAAFECLLDALGAQPAELERVYLAGAFGHRLRARSAARIGLLPVGPDRIRAVGNAALFGAKLALFEPDLPARLAELRAGIQHVSLAGVPGFEEVYVRHLGFRGDSNGTVQEARHED